MRLVSAIYNSFYPFNLFNVFTSFYCTDQPDNLRVGDVLVVWGGGDIHPSLYNKKKSQRTWCNESGPSTRDQIEWALMRRAKELGVPIIGVCRGAQMLCALEGGYLIQHVNNHAGSGHEVVTIDGEKFRVNTIHHQMMMPTGTEHEVLAWTPEKLSGIYYDEDTLVDVDKEPEFVFFNKVNGFAIQWHPEGMDSGSPATRYVQSYVEKICGNL